MKREKGRNLKNHSTEEISLPFPDRYLLTSHSVRSKERLGWIAAVLKGRRAAVQAGSEEEGTRMGEGTGQVYEDEMVVHLGQYLRGEKNQPSAEASTGDRPAGQGRQVSECRHSQCRLWLWVALTWERGLRTLGEGWVASSSYILLCFPSLAFFSLPPNKLLLLI